MVVFTGAKEHANVMHNADAIAAMRACCVRGSPVSALSLLLPGASDRVLMRKNRES